jgi:5'-3' exonuclease
VHLYIDASYLCHAAAHSESNSGRGVVMPEQVAINVLSTIGQLVRAHKATRIYTCFDTQSGSWRKKFFDGYKAQRAGELEDDPERKAIKEIADRTIHDILPQLIQVLGCPVFLHPYIEADDFAAAAIALHPDKPGMIVTADKDYWQLVSPNISCLNQTHGFMVQLGQDGTLIKRKGDGTIENIGLTPAQHLLQKAIWGDDSDNLGGLIGVGEIGSRKAILAGNVSQFLAEETGLKTRRKSSKNPNPKPEHQDARKVVARNVQLMDLLHSPVIDRVKELVSGIEAKSVRQPATYFTALMEWLVQRAGFADDAARMMASTVAPIYRDLWTS